MERAAELQKAREPQISLLGHSLQFTVFGPTDRRARAAAQETSMRQVCRATDTLNRQVANAD